MSALLMGRVFYTDLPGHLKLCLLALADHAWDDGSHVYPGQARLAVKTSVAVRTVRDQVHALLALGYLIPEPRHGQRGPIWYRIALEKLPFLDRQPTAGRQDPPGGSPLPIEALSTGSPPPLDRQPTAAKPSVTTKKKQPSDRAVRKHRLPADFAFGAELRAIATAAGCRTPDVLFVAFRDYWLGTGTPMLDWTATFRTWARRSHGASERLACGCGGLPRAKTDAARAQRRRAVEAIPDEKPARSAGEVARVRRLLEELPFMRNRMPDA